MILSTCWALLALGAAPCRERSGQPLGPAPTTGGVHVPGVGDQQPGGVGRTTQRQTRVPVLPPPAGGEALAGPLASPSLCSSRIEQPETHQYPPRRAGARNDRNDAQKAARWRGPRAGRGREATPRASTRVPCPLLTPLSCRQDFCAAPGPVPAGARAPQSPFVLAPNATHLEWAGNSSSAPGAWPPAHSLRAWLAAAGRACTDLCLDHGLVCEPSFFPILNSQDAFRK